MIEAKTIGSHFIPQAVRYYPEREDVEDGWLEAAGKMVVGAGTRTVARATGPVRDRLALARIMAIGRELEMLDDDALDQRVVETRHRLRRDGLRLLAICQGFALTREISYRTLGLRHRPVQVRGALAMLRGQLIEMDTGEGKTVTAALAAATAAMAGLPTHVVTVNNYLAERDANNISPIYKRLGLRVGIILEGMKPPDRRNAYQADVTYASNTEIAFDYLRDRLAFGPEGRQGLRQRLRRLTGSRDAPEPVMRGLHYAIIDEADSVLVDEARTPLIISRQSDPDEEAAWASRALTLAHTLEKGRDYTVDGEERRTSLTDRGRETLAQLTRDDEGIWVSKIRREEVMHQALSALFLFHRGEHYLIHDGKVQIVDEYTGRLQPDRSWSDGMHQLVEAKEEVEVTGQNLAMARMTYQRFFRRYLKLSGMTGTAREVCSELLAVYDLNVQRIPPHKRSRLRRYIPRIYRRAANKWVAVVDETRRTVEKGRPVLIGTRSVKTSDIVSAALSKAGLAHSVLNAENDSAEAEIIACAGEARRITVATNLAGRGVDIELGEGVSELGGLHVILTERHDSSRIDRQFAGRTGRRGEPGTVATLLSLEDPLIEVLNAPIARRLASLPFVSWGLRLRLFDRAQRRAERSHSRTRRDLVRQDRRLNRMLSFTGGLE
jgi:preprotein translocase subunit SecA